MITIYQQFTDEGLRSEDSVFQQQQQKGFVFVLTEAYRQVAPSEVLAGRISQEVCVWWWWWWFPTLH